MRQLAEALRASELAALKAEIAGVIWLWVKIQDPKEPLQDEAMHQKNSKQQIQWNTWKIYRFHVLFRFTIIYATCFWRKYVLINL